MNKLLLKSFCLLFIMQILIHVETYALRNDYGYQGTVEIKVGETKYIPLLDVVQTMLTYSTTYYPSGKWVLSNNSYNVSMVSQSMTGCKIRGDKKGDNIKLTFSGNMILYDAIWEYTGYYYVKVVDAEIKVTSISVSPSSTSLKVGETKQLSATVSPSNATNKSVSWSSGNTSIAYVSSNGLVTAKAAGNTTITCKANDGSGKQSTCSVTVTAADPIKVTGITLNYTSASMVAGDTKQLSATISPSNATDKTVSWSSSNTSVATVDNNGKITAKSRGTATITCKANDGSGKLATCEITVSGVKSYSNFKAKTIEGVEIQFHVDDVSSGICNVNGQPAIDKNTTGKITIPSEVEGLKVTKIDHSAFKDCAGITEVSVPNSVEDIANYGFQNCTSLKTVALNNGVKKLQWRVFDGCTSLTTVTGINKLEYISSDVFRGTPWLEDLPDGLLYLGKVLFMYKGTMPDNTTINIKEGTTQIAYRALFECKGLVGLSIPESLTTIESGNFYENNLSKIIVAPGNKKYDSRDNCNAIIETSTNTLIHGCKTSTIPNTVTTLGDYSLAYCSGLTSIVIPSSVDSIADGAFAQCDNLTTVLIGKGTRKIVNNPFYGCRKLRSISVATNNPYIDSRDDCNAIIEKSTGKLLVGCAATKIPASTKAIGVYAFYNLTIKSISIPDQVESIGNYAFPYLYNGLRSLTIGKSVKQIGKGAFIQADSLRYIRSFIEEPFDLDESVFTGSESAVNRVYDNAILYVPVGCRVNYMTTIGWNKFKKIVEVADDAMPEGTVFTDKSTEGVELTFIVTDASAKLCELITSPLDVSGKITIPAKPNGYSLTSIGKHAFYSPYDNRMITEIVVPEGVTNLCEYALYSNNRTLRSVTLPSTLTTIGNYAFYESAINSIYISKYISKIGTGAFRDCDDLEIIVVDPDNAYYYSPDGSNAIIEKSSQKLIAGCKTTNIPNGITAIGRSAFSYIDGITDIVLPASLRSIENYAFGNCKNLKSVTSYIMEPFEMDSLAFTNYEGVVNRKAVYRFTGATLYVPTGTKAKYQSTEGWKNFQNIVEFDPSALGKHVTMDADKDAPVFDLFGRKLSQPRKGINIINGRKVIVK